MPRSEPGSGASRGWSLTGLSITALHIMITVAEWSSTLTRGRARRFGTSSIGKRSPGIRDTSTAMRSSARTGTSLLRDTARRSSGVIRDSRQAHDQERRRCDVLDQTLGRGEEACAVDSPDGKVRAQSVYWLYCWAKTGMNSEEARQASVRVFDAILPVTFARFDAVTNHEYARLARYASADIEHELEETLARLR